MRRRQKRRRIGPWIVLAIAVLVAFRAALPWFLKRVVNQRLNSVPGYRGHVDDVDVALWRGAYVLRDLTVRSTSNDSSIPDFHAEAIHLSLEWRQLLRGAIVAEIELDRPRLTILAGLDQNPQQASGAMALDRVKSLVPLRINRVSVDQGAVHFRHPTAVPPIDLYLDQLQAEATNLTNSEKLSKTLVAHAGARGRAMRSGRFELDMDIDPFKKTPTFDLNFDLKDLQLPELNDFFRHYLAVEIQEGVFGYAMEAAARDGQFKGYVKPLLVNLSSVKLKEEKKSAGEVIKGFFVKVGLWLFKNPPKEQVATKIPFEGNFEDPKAGLWSAFVGLVRNGFFKALAPGVENTVDLKDVKVPGIKSPAPSK